eukprot:CAMPEP_0119152914 /NCGR_PEP_ID=MMETSP1310-20130426/48469_1 /TAXON_ID=464262 /ORGANISM="Genus nov. species nov., Strain RCC2339" /LENGTH=494 /DNA_ID=CAMNT_0007145325 /DNA_START=60 /DNA_END=1544 /DNA_ORIENTATION=+
MKKGVWESEEESDDFDESYPRFSVSFTQEDDTGEKEEGNSLQRAGKEEAGADEELDSDGGEALLDDALAGGVPKILRKLREGSSTQVFGLGIHSQLSVYLPCLGRCRLTRLTRVPALKASPDGYFDDRYMRELRGLTVIGGGAYAVLGEEYVDVWRDDLELLRSVPVRATLMEYVPGAGLLALYVPEEERVRLVDPATEGFRGDVLELAEAPGGMLGFGFWDVRKGQVYHQAMLLVRHGPHVDAYAVPSLAPMYRVRADGDVTHLGALSHSRLLVLCWWNEQTGAHVSLLDPRTGESASTFPAHRSPVLCTAELPAGDLVTGGQEGEVCLWSKQPDGTYHQVRELDGQEKAVRGLTVLRAPAHAKSPVSNILVSAAEEPQDGLFFWDPTSGHCLQVVFRHGIHAGNFVAVAASPRRRGELIVARHGGLSVISPYARVPTLHELAIRAVREGVKTKAVRAKQLGVLPLPHRERLLFELHDAKMAEKQLFDECVIA